MAGSYCGSRNFTAYGFTQAKEYAELEWPIDILIALVWIAYAVVFFGTIAKRKVKHIYVANWFYGGFILAVALLHIVNNISVPAGFMKSLPRLFRCYRRNGAMVVRP